MPTANTILDGHTTLQLRSLDRLYLNAYVPQLQRPPLVARFLEREATPIASPALFERRSKRFVQELRAYAAAHGAPWMTLKRGERKEEQWRPLCLAAEAAGRTGLVAVGVIQERVRAWRAAKSVRPGGAVHFDFTRGSVFVNQHYLYIADPEWGPAFIKISGYAPWGGRVYLNGHEWLKRQLAERGIAFRPLDNGLLSCDDPAVAQAAADGLGPAQVRAFFARHMAELPSPLTPEDRAARLPHRGGDAVHPAYSALPLRAHRDQAISQGGPGPPDRDDLQRQLRLRDRPRHRQPHDAARARRRHQCPAARGRARHRGGAPWGSGASRPGAPGAERRPPDRRPALRRSAGHGAPCGAGGDRPPGRGLLQRPAPAHRRRAPQPAARGVLAGAHDLRPRASRRPRPGRAPPPQPPLPAHRRRSAPVRLPDQARRPRARSGNRALHRAATRRGGSLAALRSRAA